MRSTSEASRAPIALTMGDPASIAGEIISRAIADVAGRGPDLVLYADRDWAAAHGITERAGLRIREVPLVVRASPGRPDPANAPAVIAAIAQATRDALSGQVRALATAPISKSVLARSGFAHPGHTEFLAALCNATGQEAMMLVSPELRVVPVSIHVALREAIERLDTPSIVRAARIAERALRDRFGIAAPRLAVAGLNPHAGEEGRMGDEETRLIAPAIDALRAEGIDARGPFPPDAMFTATARRTYDVAICMYHDQALIPLKTLDVARGVNVTIGLPIVRTSPDHGTAFDIAGQGRADPASLIAAIELADALSSGGIAA